MAGSTYGTIFKIMTWGESHGTGIGVVVDGCRRGWSLARRTFRPGWTAESPDRASSPQPGRRATGWRFSPACSRGKPLERP